jgi:integrase
MRFVVSAESLPPRAKKKEWARLERGLVRYLPTGEIWVRKTFASDSLPELRANTHETTIGKARTAAEKLIGKHRARYTSGMVAGRTLGDVMTEVLRVVTPLRRENTQEQHKMYFAELGKELGHIPLDRFTRSTWASWLPTFQAKKNRGTYKDYAKNLNMVLRYAYNNRMLGYLITIPNPDVNKGKVGRLFSEAEIEALSRAAIDRESKLQFALGYGCAMRLREALHLTWDRISTDTGLLELRAEDVKTGSKTNLGRKFFVTKEALTLLRQQKVAVGDRSPFVFPSPLNPAVSIDQNKTAWAGMKRRAGIKGRARFHDLRHSRISHLLFIHKLRVEFVSEYVGTSIMTLQRVYMHSSPENTRAISEIPMIPSRVDNEKTVNGPSMEVLSEEEKQGK